MTGLSQHVRESRRTPNWKEIEILSKVCSFGRKLGQPFEQLKGEKNYKLHLECNNYSNQS